MLLLKEIENKFHQELNDVDNWPYLRRIVGSAFINRDREIKGIKKNDLLKYKLVHLVKSFRGIKNIFSKYNIIIFGTSDNFRKVDGYYVDRFCHDIISNSDNFKSLYIEKSDSRNHKKVLYSRISFFLFRIFSYLYLNKPRPNSLLKKINTLYGLNINFIAEERKFNALYKTFKLYFKIVKPKIVVVTCYSFQEAVKAANDLNIKTVEYQHGVIRNNYAYDYRLLNKNKFTPAEIIVFGLADELNVKKYKYTDNIVVGGNFFQNFVKTNFKSTSDDVNKIKICVTLQDPCFKVIMEVVSFCAVRNKHIDFIIIPRNIIPEMNSDIDNMKILSQYNLYEIMKMSDYHITAYSTSCYEASSFGLYNLFFNLKGLSVFYYKDFIERNNFNEIFEEKEGMSNYMKNLKKNKIKYEIMSASEYHFSSYKKILNV
jgi:hypothetical protein